MIRSGVMYIIYEGKAALPKTHFIQTLEIRFKVLNNNQSMNSLIRLYVHLHYSGQDTWKGWRMTDYRRERQSYVSRAGGD